MLTDLTLLWAVLGALVGGVVCTLAVQWVSALRQATRDVGDAARQVSKLAAALVPAAQGIEHLADMLGESRGDLQTVQGSFHKLALASTEVTDSLQRVGRWVGIVTPLVVAVVERWTHEQGAARRTHDEGPTQVDPSASSDGREPAFSEASRHPS